MDNLGEIIRRLHESEVEFTIIGGITAIKHGTSYVTYDLDICARFAWGRPQDHLVLPQLRALQEKHGET